MIIGFLTLGPVVIGFTTYSMQNSIYFDFETVFIYFLGDAVILYVLSLLVVSALVMQLQFISKWLQSKFFNQGMLAQLSLNSNYQPNFKHLFSKVKQISKQVKRNENFNQKVF